MSGASGRRGVACHETRLDASREAGVGAEARLRGGVKDRAHAAELACGALRHLSRVANGAPLAPTARRAHELLNSVHHAHPTAADRCGIARWKRSRLLAYRGVLADRRRRRQLVRSGDGCRRRGRGLVENALLHCTCVHEHELQARRVGLELGATPKRAVLRRGRGREGGERLQHRRAGRVRQRGDGLELLHVLVRHREDEAVWPQHLQQTAESAHFELLRAAVGRRGDGGQERVAGRQAVEVNGARGEQEAEAARAVQRRVEEEELRRRARLLSERRGRESREQTLFERVHWRVVERQRHAVRREARVAQRERQPNALGAL